MEARGVVELVVVDRQDLSLIKPLDPLAVFPESIFDLVVFGHDVGSKAVLLSFEPEAFVRSSIRPGVNSKAMLFVVFILTLVLAPVVPDVDSHALHVVVEPLSFVATAVKPGVDSDAGDLVFPPVTGVS